MNSQKIQKFNNLQAGRGIAAALVVLYHSANHLRADFGHLPLWGLFHFGRAGVDFFFVLSGFIIFFVHEKDIGNPIRLKSYLLKRFIRIFPIYWIVIFVLFGIGLVTHKAPTLSSFLIDATLLPVERDNILGVAWSLRFELFFYGIFAIAILSRYLGAILLVFVSIGTLLQIFFKIIPQTDFALINTIFSPWNIEFILGMFAAYYLSRNIVKYPRIFFFISLFVFLMLGWLENQYFLDGRTNLARGLYGIVSMLILISIVELERSNCFTISRFWVFLGEASYSIYLIHLLSFGIAYKILVALGILNKIPLDVTYILLFIAGVTGGVVMHLSLELPVMRLIRKLTHP